ncbi:MAG: hypothetical protein IPK26_03430 [Planctomycetes bacterium]|nr:hypothetical protein [Planctomycetota bacterium]
MRHALLAAFAVAVTLTFQLPGQGDFDLDKGSPGTLGDPLQLRVRAAPANQLLLVMMGFTAGPTAIAQFDPADTRSVELDLGLAGNWYLLVTDGSGAATISTATPADPTLHGVVLHWQTATLPGTTTLVGAISNRVLTQVGTLATASALPDPLLSARAAATLCWQRNRNAGQGDFLLVSGATTETFQFRTLASAPGPTMATPRALHAAATLNDGRVLFTGGLIAGGAVTATCEVWDPATNTFAPVADMLGVRAGHAAATLPDGRVMVAGGTINFTDLTIAATNSLATTEIWNPATNTWTAGPSIGGRRIVPALTRLANGRMLICGGIEVTVFFGIPIAVSSTVRAQLYDPATNAWTAAASMPAGRAYHHDNQITLANGKVLMSGGVLVPDLLNAANSASIANADVYDPVTNTWAASSMAAPRTGHTATRLLDGRVVVTGGTSGLLSAPTPLAAVEIFDPVALTWSASSPLTQTRVGHTAALLPDGMLVILGGTSVEALRF